MITQRQVNRMITDAVARVREQEFRDRLFLEQCARRVEEAKRIREYFVKVGLLPRDAA